MDRTIEIALQPGRFVSYRDGYDFVSELHQVEAEIANLTAADPPRAVTLYETFMAGCNEKTEEIDDSDGGFGMFFEDLACGWIKARQAAGADDGETARLLLGWMEDNPYGFLHDIEREAVKAFRGKGLAAFEREVLARFEKAFAAQGRAGGRKDPEIDYRCRHWGGKLKTIYCAQRSAAKYIDLTSKLGLTRADCEAVATIFQAKGRLPDALSWTERGLEFGAGSEFDSGSGYKLAAMRRALLRKLGRREEALESAWAEFQKHPAMFTYQELFRYTPKAGRAEWHAKAMEAAEHGHLDSLIELWLGVKEIERLARRLDLASNHELESLSHYVTEPAAGRLAKTHPGVAAKVFRALCLRIINAGKSKYYFAALTHLEKAKNCYKEAGLEAEWHALAAEIRKRHSRKSSFMPGFERIATGARSPRQPSFLDRARRRWARPSKLT